MFRKNILILYGYLDYPMRATTRDLVYSFSKNTNARCYYYTPELGNYPEYLKRVKFDLVIFTTELIGDRWNGREIFKKKITDKLEFLKTINAVKVVHPQDEWIETNVLNDFINEFGISHVFTVAPRSEWKIIYNKIDHAKIKFHEVLTGYLDDNTLSTINRILKQDQIRSIDIGYRATQAPAWYGSHGYLKTRIAEVFSEEAPKNGFKIDISTNVKDTFLGDEWFKFTARCKYFIGVEGGCTILDPDGEIYKKGMAYRETHPKATFEEYEKNCFPGMDGNLKLIAISPRHLECCATKTCQVLIEGWYNGILKPGIHYIEIKKDFSNLKEVFEKMKDEDLRKKITEAAYTDIVASQKYSYKGYTQFVLEESLKEHKSGFSFYNPILHLKNLFQDKWNWESKRSHKNPDVLTFKNILIKLYINLGIRKVKKLLYS